MTIIQTKTLSVEQFNQINQLWNDEYPIKLANRFPILLDGVENYMHYLIEDQHQNILAWAVDFEKENQIRFSIIVGSQNKNKGFGKLLIEQLMLNHHEFYGWVIDHNNDYKVDGTFYKSPIPFYLKLDFEILNDQRIESEMIRAVKIKWKK